MKRYGSIFFALLFSLNAFAALSPDEQRLADMALSGDIKQLDSAAKTVARKKQASEALLDIFAEVLYFKYPDALASEIDTLAWVARAIGNTENGRYYFILREIHDNTQHKKLRRHVDTALDDLDAPHGTQYQAGTFSLPKEAFARETAEQRDARVESLILSGDLKSLKEAARVLIDTKAQNVALTDMLAEVLLNRYADAQDHQVDTLAWVARALGASNSGRYNHVLVEVEENGVTRKLRRYADNALDEHGEAKGEQYQKGMVGKALPEYAF